MIVGAVINGRLVTIGWFARRAVSPIPEAPKSPDSNPSFASGGKQAGCRPSTVAAKVNPQDEQ